MKCHKQHQNAHKTKTPIPSKTQQNKPTNQQNPPADRKGNVVELKPDGNAARQ